ASSCAAKSFAANEGPTTFARPRSLSPGSEWLPGHPPQPPANAAFPSPVSTTHTITGGIVGVDSVRRLSAVRWGLAGDMVIAWLVTMPAAALVGAISYLLTRLVG